MSIKKRRPKKTRSAALERFRRSLLGRSTARNRRFEQMEDRRMLSATPYQTVADNLNSQLTGFQTQLTSILDALKTGTTSIVPFVGNKLGEASKIVNQFGQTLHDAIATLGSIDDPQGTQLISKIESALAAGNPTGVVAQSVAFSQPGNLGANGFEIDMQLIAATGSSTPIDFNTGLPSLPIKVSVNGSLDVTAGFDFELAFTYNSNTQSVGLDDTKTLSGINSTVNGHSVAIFVSAGIPSTFNATAIIGFVQGSLTPIPGQTNALTLAVLVDKIASQPTVDVTGTADANLRLEGSFAGTNGAFPGIDVDFHLHWGIDSNNPSAAAPVVSFDNVELNLGSYLSKVVAPFLQDIQEATAPVKPINDILEYPLPGLTDLSEAIGGGKIDLLKLGGPVAAAFGFGPYYEVGENIINVINELDQASADTDGVLFPLGGFNFNDDDLRLENIASDISDLDVENLTDLSLDANEIEGIAKAGGQFFDNTVSSLDIPQSVKDELHHVARLVENGVQFSYPAINDPVTAVFKMLLGQDTDLVSITGDATFDAEGSFATGLSIFGVGIDYGGEIHVDAHLHFAYDTYGLRRLINDIADDNLSPGEIAKDVGLGFYMSDDSYFKMSGQVFLGAETGLGIFSVTAGGFISTGDNGNDPVTLTIDDPNKDGKLRADELSSNPFELHGEFTGALGIQVKVGVEVLGHFYGWKKRFDIATDVILDFDHPNSSEHPGKQDSDYTLASDPDANGNIQLYIGALANKRDGLFVDNTDGDTKMIVSHVDGDSASGTETVKISLLQHTPIGGQDYWVSETISGVKSITGIGDNGNLDVEVQPNVTSNVDLEGGQGIADLDYYGSGTAYLKAGNEDSDLVVDGPGASTFVGGPGSDIIQLGSGGTSVTGGAGANTVIITTPLTANGSIVGGTDPGNIVVVVSGPGTQSISATPGDPGMIDLNYQVNGQSPGPQIVLSEFSTFVASAQDAATDIQIGDLSGAGITEVIVNEVTSGATGRHVELDPRAGLGSSQLALLPFVHTYDDGFNPGQTITDPTGMELQNITTGVTTYLLGVHDDDVTTIHQHGGTLTVGQLANDDGTIVFDGSQRQAGQSDVVTMTTPVIPQGNTITTAPDAANNFVLNAVNYPTFVFVGMVAIDSMIMNVAAPGMATGTNNVLLDASTLAGSLTVNAQGDSTAKNSVAISKLSSRGTITFQGGTSSSSVSFGTGRLADIQGNVDVHNAVLTIDNSAAQGAAANSSAPGGSIMTMNGSTFVGWDIPGFAGTNPALTYTGLYGQLTVNGGQADQFDMEATPSTVTSAVFNNHSGMRDSLYFVTWNTGTTTNGDFAIFFGQRLHTDGSVERLKHLTGVANVSFVVNQNGPIDAGTNIVFDGDLDPAGAVYTINGGPLGGSGGLHIINQTENLEVEIKGYRPQDQAYIYLPGGTVSGDFTQTSPGIVTVDGQARLAGTNPDAPNTISAALHAGVITLDPTGTFDSSLKDYGGNIPYNTVNVLGAKPQDSLSATEPTQTAIAPTSVGTPSTSFELHDQFSFFSDYTLLNPPADAFFIVLATQYPIDAGPSLTARTALLDQDFLASMGVDYNDQTVAYTNVQHPEQTASVLVREFPISSNPQAEDNLVSLDASQLRGIFNFGVNNPDYASAATIVNSATGFTASDQNLAITSYGQTHVTLSKVNPELSVNISGTSEITQSQYGSTELGLGGLNIPQNPPVVTFAATDVTIGDSGVLANIQGNVAVHQAWLKDVDDRSGTSANNFTLTSTTYTGWATISGTHPTLSMDTLQGELTLSGNAQDQFDVEDTPNSAMRTTIRNFTTDGTAPGVYVMGKTTAPLYVNGHFSVYAGRRLNADGSVTNVGKVDNLYNLNDKFVITGGTFGTVYSNSFLFDGQLQGSKTLSGLVNIVPGFALANWLIFSAPFNLSLPLFVNYVGAAQGTLVFDTSGTVYMGSVFDDGLEPNPNYPGEADLRYGSSFDKVFGDVIYGANLEVFDYGPQLRGGSPQQINRLGATVILNNPLTLPFHYISNPNSVNAWEQIEVGATTGPESVVGRDSFTRVDVDPTYSHDASSLFFAATGGLPGWGTQTGGNNLLTTLLGDLTVSHAGLTIHANVAGSGAPATTPQVAVTDSQTTGIAGAAIHYSNLADGYETITQTGSLVQVAQFPGLMIRMPTYGGGDVQVQNTPGGATTEIDTLTNAIGNVTVQATTGTLSLADLSSFGHDEFFNFAAASVNIGGGSLLGIKGNVDIGASYAVPLTTFDDSNDTTAPQMTLQDLSNITLGGASTGSVVFQSNIPTTSHFDIHGAANAQWTINDAQPNTQLFANTGSQVSITRGKNSFKFPPITILGAQSVLLDGLNGVQFDSSSTVKIAPDPARPTDPTNLTVDLRTALNDNYNVKLDNAGSGFYAFFVKPVFGSAAAVTAITYQGSTTPLTFLTDALTVDHIAMTVADTGSAGTTINANKSSVNVLGDDGPLEIDQGGGGKVTLGNSGNLQGIHNPVTIVASNAALPPVPLVIDDSADATNATVAISPNGSGGTQISGVTTSPIQLTGSFINVTLNGGTGNNTLVGPDAANAWDITSANGGVLNRTIAFSKFGNLQGGSQNDNFFFIPGGSLSGNLDGGPGTDTLYYQAGMLTGSDVIDLPNHIAPRVTGQALNLEASNTYNLLAVTNPGQQNIQVNVPINLAITSTGGFGTKTFTATGLPTGVSINSATGVISGTNTTDNFSSTIVVTVTDDSGTISTSFHWSTLPGLIITPLSTQSSQVNQVINLPIVTSYTYGGTLTFTGSNLPPGLTVNPQTGTISGTISGNAQSYFTGIAATDGTHSTSTFFTWNVFKSFAVVNPGTQTFPENLPVSLQMQAVNGNGPITYSATGLPGNLQINSQTGLISGILGDISNSSGHFVNFSVQVSANDTHQTVSTTFTFGTEPGFRSTGTNDRTNVSGDTVNTSVGDFDPDGKSTVSILSVTGLPTGLTFDSTSDIISGTIAGNAFTGSPYHVTVNYNNVTYGYTYPISFNWTVTPGAADITPPTSNVSALPAFETSGTFTVAWSGTDNSGGSGIASYNIFVSDNGGAYTSFQSATTQTSASFTGVDGHTYHFYSVATDNAANVEQAPTTPDATTLVDLTAPTSSINSLPTYQQSGSIPLTWSGSDGANGSGIAGFDIYVSDNSGAYTLWKHESAATTSDTYSGTTSHSYRFYSRATDNAGNVEAAPGAADATILIDSTAPSSSVNLLSAYITSTSFQVSWSGSDGANGSGIAFYDIYVSDNSGAFTLFQSHTTETSASFNGQDGHLYGFYSVATDNAGNVETVPNSADTAGFIDATPPTSSIAFLPATQQSTNIQLAWSGSDGANGSNIASFDIYVSDNNSTYSLWKHESGSKNSDTYVGAGGHTYSFYSIATDNAGNVEAAPNVPDATTQVIASPPSSSVNPLAAYQPLTSIQLSWTGVDNSGTGIAGFDIYVSDNSGSYTLWKHESATTLADTYTGADGHRYSFYSIATDNAGDTEQAPATADATTLIDATAPISSINSLSAYQLSANVQLTWSGSDGANGSGIAGFDIYVSDNSGAYTLWKHESAATMSDTYAGTNGHTYGFYSIATDNAGNVEAAPATADASTLVDLTAPISSVTTLPNYEASSSFTVAWSGNDGGSGSGIASFDIYVSDNGGAYTLFQSHTTGTSATFTGQDSHQYRFYSVATDNAGNVELAPTTPDATTLVDLTAPVSAVNPLSATQQSSSIQLSWSGSDGANGSGIAAFDIYVSDNSGAYTLWKHESATTASDTYSGANGHTYSFYSIATDNAGNVEAAPGTADATTTINVSVVNQVVFDSATGIMTIGGSDGNDTILVAPDSKGKNVQVTINGQVASNNIPLTSVTQINVLGYNGSDSVTLTNISKSVSIDGGDGADKLNIVGPVAGTSYRLGSSAISIGTSVYSFNALENLTIVAGKGANTFAVSAVPAMPVEFFGGKGADTVIGPDLPNSWAVTSSGAGTLDNSVLFAAVENLTGGALGDIFDLSAGQKISGKIDGGAGTDELLYGGYSKAVTVNLQTGAATNTGAVANIEAYMGGANTDTLVGPNKQSQWLILGANTGIVGGITFSSFENLTGGTAADTFEIGTAGSIGGKLDGGKLAANTLDYSANTATVAVNLQTKSATGVASFTNIQTLVGSPTTTLVGSNTSSTWLITGHNAGTVSGLNFTAVPNLVGGAKSDAFQLMNAGNIGGLIDGGGGNDLLSFASVTTQVTVNLSDQSSSAGRVANIEMLIGGRSNNDTLIGSNTANTWNVNAAGTGQVNAITYTSFENLVGGSAADRFVLGVGAKVAGHIDGGAGNNTLDYSKYPTAVSVNLTTGTATNVNGGVSNFNVVIGGSGADNLTGSSGRDLLFGGSGADKLTGGAGDDILFDTTPGFAGNVATIDSLLTYWNRTDLDYLTRVTQLRTGTTGIVGLSKLNSANVKNDSSKDTLTGGADNDWFFATVGTKNADVITDLESGEQVD